MISNVVLRETISGIKSITNTDLTVVDVDGDVQVSTLEDPDIDARDIQNFAELSDEMAEIKGRIYLKIKDKYQDISVLVVEGSGDNAGMIGKMAAFQLENLMVAYKEHYDRENFIKNLLLDNLLIVDIYNRAKKLNIDTDARRVVFILESEQSRDYSTLEAVKEVFSTSHNDFITAIDERSIIVVKQMGENEGAADMKKVAESIMKAAGSDAADSVHVAYGTIIHELREVSRSYKEARMALDVGKIFFADQAVVAYSQLGIGRLIYQLPTPLCKMFIKEIFGNKNPEDFEAETFETINKFFENSLNVSETSRQLYIHRNTLVYRLDKLEKSTGLDLRVFDDAITFKIALMVVQYMKYMKTLDY